MSDEQIERLQWLEHCLADPDCGRLISRTRMYAMAEEAEFLRELKAQADRRSAEAAASRDRS